MQRRFVAETAGYRHFAGRCDSLWNSNMAALEKPLHEQHEKGAPDEEKRTDEADPEGD